MAGLLGFALPLSGLRMSTLLPDLPLISDYPDQLTIVRLVTLGCLVWIVLHPAKTPLPKASRRMLQVFAMVMGYAAVTLFWAPELRQGMLTFVKIGLALCTGVAVVLLVRGERRALRSFAVGVLLSGALQVVVAVVEVTTGRHLSLAFGADYVTQWNLASIEQVVGKVAWGSLGNPNDLGGYLLLATAVFLSRAGFGVRLGRLWTLLGGAVLLLSVVVSLTALDDARAYRLGLATLVVMHLWDRFLPPLRSPMRVPLILVVTWAVVAAAAVWAGPLLAAGSAGASDTLRMDLFWKGISIALATGGFGRGLGTEQALIDSGAIPLNFHNVVAQLAAELGLVVAAALLAYLLWLVVSWALVTRSARRMGHEVSLARASLAVVLMVYGVTSSGVLESPHYWGFFAVTAVLAGIDREAEEPKGQHCRGTAGASRVG